MIMGKWLKKLKNLLYLCIGLPLLILPVITFFTTPSTPVLMTVIMLCGLAGIAVFLLLNCKRKEESTLLIQLSELIHNITELRDEQIFPENEDSLVSKLQDQVLKLSGILKAQKENTATEKAELETIISDLSHQLKTPIATLSLYGELLETDGLTAQELKENLIALNVCIRKLSFLIDSMIKMSRMESGLIQLCPSKNSLNETLLTAVKEVLGPAKRKHISLVFSEKEDVSCIYDSRWTKEAIFNLLENAVKYTQKGGVISITVVPYEVFVRIDIRDNGIGIAPEELPKIFARFYRGNNSSEQEGLGIGLYLSRKIITEQGGYLKAASDKNGSIFSVFLPQ